MESSRVLSDRYRLIEHIARGGMADVYAAEDLLLGRKVAVKILHSHFAADQAFIRRFYKEAQAAANLTHPNIVSIFDSGRDGDTYYLVMELIVGRTLRDVLRSEGALLPRRAAEIAAEAAAALSVAHAAGVINRDVKPANIMLSQDGGVKMADFGIARAMDDSEELTRTGAVIGTATYFSPEQAQGLPVNERSDIYSLGVVLYELLAGIPPFSAESPIAVAYQHVSEYAAPPSVINPDVPHGLDAIVMRALEKRPEDRYQSADEFRNDLLRFLRGEQPMPAIAPDSATVLMAQQPPPATVPPDETARHVAYQYEEEPNQTLYVIGIVGLVIALALGVFFLARALSGGGEAANGTVIVPDLEGLDADAAFEALQEADLKVRSRPQTSLDVPAGIVIGSDPVAGEEVPVRSFVTVIVSTGPETFPVPNLIDLTEAVAIERIEANSFVAGPVEYVFDENAAEGIVVDQNPGPGVDAAPGSVVTIKVSQGALLLEMPPVVGLTRENATRILTQAGFETIEIEEETSIDVLAGFVIGSDPEAGSLEPRGNSVKLVVSLGPPPVALPSLIGLSVTQAQGALDLLGLELAVDPVPLPVTLGSGLVGLVAQQSPAANSEIEVGTIITIKLGELRKVQVPNVVGFLESQAKDLIESSGLVWGVQGTVEDANNVGFVVSQSVAAQSSVPEGTQVLVTVGVAPPTTTTTTTTSTTTTTTTTTTVP